MRGLGGKRGATDRSPITDSPITITDAELATTIFVRDPTAPAFPSGRSLEPAPTGPGATCCHDAPAAPHLACATPINLGYLYIAGNRTGSRITAR